MAGGDFALIKSVEGFEDFTAFGRKQLRDLGVRAGDVVFAITEGGETSFVIGTAWAGVEAGAKVYFVYNNPDEVLCKHVQRSREVIEDPRIEKINLTTGPMAITGSTRMQATSIQLCVLLTVLEMVLRDLMWRSRAETRHGAAGFGERFRRNFQRSWRNCTRICARQRFLAQLAKLVALEESFIAPDRKIIISPIGSRIDVLTDTTERSPTYCTPPFRKFDDATAAESWAFLVHAGKRNPACLGTAAQAPAALRGMERGRSARAGGRGKIRPDAGDLRKISRAELMRFRIGQDGLAQSSAWA